MSIFSKNYKNYDEFMYDFAAAALRKARVKGEFEILSYDLKRVIISAGEDPNKRSFCIRIWSSNNYNFCYSVFEHLNGESSGTSIVSNAEYILPAFQELENAADRIWDKIYHLASLVASDNTLMEHFEKYFPDDMDLGDLPGAVLHYLGQYRYLKEEMGKPLN